MSMRTAKRVSLAQSKAQNKEKADPADEKVEIPKIIHFIWAGGDLRMPKKNLEVMLKWGIKNPDWKIYLWVDDKTDQGVIDNGDYHVRINRLLENKKFDDLGYNEKNALLEQIEIKDISRYMPDNNLTPSSVTTSTTTNQNALDFRDEFVGYEIDKLNPNYGASSDLLRYAILYEIGGAYFDTDVLPGSTSLSEIQLSDLPAHVLHILYVENFSQHKDVSAQVLRDFEDFDRVGNDAFVSTKRNLLMGLLADTARANYDRRNELKAIESAYCGKNISDATIDRTGPNVVGNMMLGSTLVDDHRVIGNVIIRRLRDGINEFSVPEESNQSLWLEVGVKVKGFETAIMAVYHTIEFEIKHFGIIRVEDHINDIIASCNPTENQKNDAIRMVLKLCARHLNKCPIVQVVGHFDEVMAFFDKNKSFSCKTLFDLKDQALNKALDCLLLQRFFAPVVTAESVAKLGVKLEICGELMSQNLKAISAIINNLERFPHDERENVVKQLKFYLNDYTDFLGFVPKGAIDKEKMNVLMNNISACSRCLTGVNYTASSVPLRR